METFFLRSFRFRVFAIGMASLLCSGNGGAATTDLATAPLASSSNTVVRPNTLFILDDSGSMGWDYLPDYVGGGGSGTRNHCKLSNTCGEGETPFDANEYNGVEYNPRVNYLPPVNADGTLKASQVSPWTSVKKDGYGVQSTGTINLTNGYPEVWYCDPNNSADCKHNGVDTYNPFSLRATVADNPPYFAFPGNAPSSGTTTVTSLVNLYNGTLNQPTTTQQTVFNGTLTNASSTTTTTTLSVSAISRSGTTVTVTYTGTPTIAVGDTVVVSGNNCSNGFNTAGSSVAVDTVNTTTKKLTYTWAGGTTTTKTSCTVRVSHTTPPASTTPPSITYDASVITVTLAAAHGLVTGDTVVVTNGASTCDAGYKTGGATVTVVNSTTFTYPTPAASSNTGSTSCKITTPVTTPPSAPGISLSGNIVTLKLTGHGLVTGDLIQVSNGATGTCSTGYNTSGVSKSVTVLDANTLTYSTTTASPTNANCKVDKVVTATVPVTVSYTSASTKNGAPYYFVIVPIEFCDSIYLTNCTKTSEPTGIYTHPAPVRFCKDAATAALAPGDTNAQGAANCQGKYSVGTGMNFQYVRYGLFYRVDIVPSRTTYGNEVLNGIIKAYGVDVNFNNITIIDRNGRAGDGTKGTCAAAPNCTYDEEMTNFANWYAYYRTRMQMMKTSAGRAFLSLDNRYRVGFVTINVNSWTTEYLAAAPFDQTQKTNWYSKFYAINPGDSTPLREALARAGRYFAGKHGLPGDSMNDDPVEYSCQQNFALLTTDGYWNGTTSNVVNLQGSQLGNHDDVDSGFTKRADGAFDGAISGATNTLADVAAYYYKTDLRNSSLNNCTGVLGTDVCPDNVPTTNKDSAGHQHMTTFSIGLADGLMTYQSDYETALTGDLARIKAADTGCPFSGSGTCNWPLPVADGQSALDDLWHAAVNGRGTYYNARDPVSLSKGLSGALAGMNIRLAAAAASSTSSPNITQTDRSIFSSTYRTTVWDGEVVAQYLDPTTGNVITSYPGTTNPYVWSAQAQLDAKVAADATGEILGRTIYTFDSALTLPRTTGTGLKPFLYSNLTLAEKAYFDNKCSFAFLSQCTPATLSAIQLAEGNSGTNMIAYLRGQKSLEGTTPYAVYRPREHILGDTVNARPAYIKQPTYSFIDAVTPTYAQFKAANATRQGVLYIPSNDGMLHAFNADTGDELWAYVPKMVMPRLYKLTDANYANNHAYFVDGSPTVMDVYVDSAMASSSGLGQGWHTILVAGLNLGGRGYYALDVSDPLNPEALWEICSDSTLCNISDTDIGYSYGNPVITKRNTDGKWVVAFASGYNNIVPGTGQGFLFVLDAITGAILTKTNTGSGTTTTPSGLAKISAYIDNATNNRSRFIYGGDLNGDLWRFDLGASGSSGSPTVSRIATLKDAGGVAQPITTRPALGDVLGNTNSLIASGTPVVYVATGRYLGASDLSNTQVQSVYALKDDLTTTTNLGSPRIRVDMIAQTVSQVDATTRSASGGATINWLSNEGWYADFTLSAGERVNIDPQIVVGALTVATNVPETSACTVGGYSWLYNFDYNTGTAVATKAANALIVGIVIVRITTTDATGKTVIKYKAIITDATGNKRTVDVPANINLETRPISWRELIP